ncbi:MAG: methyltransferase domain-containing protein [Butyrivibrio sp.]|nr:methyltransferase domain-containing protein [Butyrivibrio sp.]
MQQIGSSNNSSAVKEQYATSRGLDTRISFHDKYSTNKQGYGNWIFSHYEIREGMHILEIGCGNGSLWMGHDDDMARCGRLVLTDLSEGMLSTAKAHLGERDNVSYMLADIQDIPFEDNSFDMVIANAMLYHVPDLDQGLREVRRVLKDGGAFCCATFGEHNFAECLAEWFRLDAEHFQPNHNFTLENGTQQLQTYFSEVQTLYYEDSLHVTDIEDLVEYLRSLASFKAIIEIPVPRIREILEKHAQDGVIDLPKEYGMFICR